MLGDITMITLIAIIAVWLIFVVSAYDYSFSTENIPKFRKIGDSEDKVLQRMREFYYVCFGISTVLAVLAFIFI